MRDGGQTPQHDGQGETSAHPEPVHHPSGENKSKRVSELKAEDDRGINALIRPAELLNERRFENPDDLSVDVIDGCGEEEERTNDPSVIPHTPGCYSRRIYRVTHNSLSLRRTHVQHVWLLRTLAMRGR